MATCKPIDYDVLCDELLKHYLEPACYSITKIPINFVISDVTATTIDEYIKLLSMGYINVSIREELDEYIDELLKDKWFHQWPLVRFEFASRELSRKTEVNYKKKKKTEETLDDELDILSSLAKEGWPNAMVTIGMHNYIYGGLSKYKYETYICLCVFAHRKGYQLSGHYLFTEFITGKYEQLCEELQLLVLKETSAWILKANGATLDNYIEKLDDYNLAYYKKMCKKIDKLKEPVSHRMFMRNTSGKLFWPVCESPYDIKF